jgi:hypothetical protein
MYRPSVISDDWVIKGFHLHVGRVELAIRPGHKRGMVVCKRVFSSSTPQEVQAAAKSVRERCLADPAVRRQWCETINRAIAYLNGCRGELEELANGRKKELTFLKHALNNYEVE